LAWSNQESLSQTLNLTTEFDRGSFYNFDQILNNCQKLKIATKSLNLYAGDADEIEIEFLDGIESFGNNFDIAVNQIGSWFKSGYKVIFSATGAGTLKRFSSYEQMPIYRFILAKVREILMLYLFSNPQLHMDLSVKSSEIVLITEKDISGQRSVDKDLARMPSRRKKAIDPLSSAAGDYVVHEQHGVGRYLELINRSINGVSREYLVLEYASL
jgi:transcription-repair coupling factor (superfamily II helicase)